MVVEVPRAGWPRKIDDDGGKKWFPCIRNLASPMAAHSAANWPPIRAPCESLASLTPNMRLLGQLIH